MNNNCLCEHCVCQDYWMVDNKYVRRSSLSKTEKYVEVTRNESFLYNSSYATHARYNVRMIET